MHSQRNTTDARPRGFDRRAGGRSAHLRARARGPPPRRLARKRPDPPLRRRRQAHRLRARMQSRRGGPKILGEVAGTCGYMAPEVLRREAVSPLSDLYSLGALAYRLLAGQPSRACGGWPTCGPDCRPASRRRSTARWSTIPTTANPRSPNSALRSGPPTDRPHDSRDARPRDAGSPREITKRV